MMPDYNTLWWALISVQMHLEDDESTDAQKLGRIADVVGEALPS